MMRELLGPIELRGDLVRLEPLAGTHLDDLARSARDPRIWTWMPQDLRPAGALEAWLESALAAQRAGVAHPYAVVIDGHAVGSTRFMEVRPEARTVEIGWTWYSPPHWGTRVNPECKLLLLRHAFEVWGANRVQLKTDGMNLHSQAGIRKLGAVFEGTLRNHRVRIDGSIADTAMFSILPHEWPAVKARLETRLQASGLDVGGRARQADRFERL
ncbi:MAG: GNAT family N-acetyltransferase [Candidatus Dormibacteraceae bacterium]